MTLILLGLWTALAILAALAVLQLALASGAPFGHFAWGGGQRVLTRPMRAASLVSIVLYAAFALVLGARAGAVDVLPPAIALYGAWAIAAYFWLGVAMNAISLSPAERFTMTPAALILALCATLIALG